jgi:NAD(P)-dependent dehydrogenase (short-subunit alcohol dehydrogenase family)
MLATDWGRVIAVASIAGLHGVRGAGCYAATKHGVIGLIRSLSEDFMGKPYTFNALCPGYVDTPIVTRNIDSISARAGLSADQALAVMVDANPHKRLIAPEEVAAAALWLVRPGSQSINGQAIQIAGGQI